MNKVIFALFVFLLMASCKQQENEQKWPYELYWQVIRGTDQEVYYLPFTSEQTKRDSLKVLNYYTIFDTTTYSINNHNPKIAELTRNNEQMLFKLVQEHFLEVKEKEFVVYQFSTADGSIDAGSEHYWNEQLGFFFVRAKYWPNYWIMQFADDGKNAEVWQIVKKLYPEIRTSLKLNGIQDGEEHLRQDRLQVIK